jgi:secondary thiamine-phosphate synthase enzyme
VKTKVLAVHTGSGRGVFDITREAAEFVHGLGDGLLNIFIPHATAGVAILETGAGSDHDFMGIIDDLIPRVDRYRHRHGSPGHGADHVLPGIVSPSTVIPVVAGSLALGTWQSIVLIDPNLDNADRKVRFSFLEG